MSEPAQSSVRGDADLNEILDGEPLPGFIRWKRKNLSKLKKFDLTRMAIAEGWERADIDGISKDLLVTLMIDGQARPPGVE